MNATPNGTKEGEEMGLGSQLMDEEKSSVEKLKERNAALKGEATETPKPAPAKRKNGSNGATASAKPAKPAKTPVKAEGKNGKAKPAKTPVKAEGKGKAKPKVEKPKSEKRTRTSRPDGVKMTTRSLDRNKDSDGLRDIERSLLKIVEKAPDGTISIINLAGKFFKKDPSELPSEGEGSIRAIRNAVRRPMEMGILEAADRGAIRLTKAYRKDGLKLAEKWVDRARKAREEKRATRKAEKGDAKPAKTKKAEKGGKGAKKVEAKGKKGQAKTKKS